MLLFLSYNFLMLLLAPWWVTRMLWRSWRRNAWPNWKERFGHYNITPLKDKKRLWFHAVSVGEVIASLPILSQLRNRAPNLDILLSVTTTTGYQTAKEIAEAFVDHLVYFPLDIPRFQLSAMNSVRPDALAIMETELWLDFLWAAKTVGAKTMLVNGRISDKNFSRSQPIKFFYRGLLKYLDAAYMQTQNDADRLMALGAHHVEVVGNCKYDQALEAAEVNPKEWRMKLRIPEGLPVLVIGSTRGEEEESFVLDAVQKVGLNKISVVHAPRHLERVEQLQKQVQQKFGHCALRSKGESSSYLILDTYGELSSAYSIADIVVVGGGFSMHGGHNILQPLALGKPVLHGPHMQNFAEVTEGSLKTGSSKVCPTSESLATAIEELLRDDQLRQKMSQSAQEFVKNNLDASARYADKIIAALET